MDSNDETCPPHRETLSLVRHIRTCHRIATRRLVACDPNTVPNGDPDDIFHRKALEALRRSQEQLGLCLATESLRRRLASQEKSHRDCRNEFGKLSTCIPTLRKQLEEFWSCAAEFSRRRTQCQGRSFGRRSSHLKQYLELALDFKPSDYYLGPTAS